MSICEHTRVVRVSGKTSDMNLVIYHDGTRQEGYVPSFGIGGGDYISLSICVDCHEVLGFDTGQYEESLQEVKEERA